MNYYDLLFYLSIVPLFFVCIVAVGGLACISMFLVWGIDKIWPTHKKSALASSTLTAVLLLTGLVFFYVGYDVLQLSQRAHLAVEREQIALDQCLQQSAQLPGKAGDTLHRLVENYARTLVDQDWPAMGERSASTEGDTALNAIGKELATLSQNVHALPSVQIQSLAEAVVSLSSARVGRLLIARYDIGPILPVIIGVLLFVSAFVLAERHKDNRRDMVIGLFLFSLGFGTALFAVTALDRPFAGASVIQPQAVGSPIKY